MVLEKFGQRVKVSRTIVSDLQEFISEIKTEQIRNNKWKIYKRKLSDNNKWLVDMLDFLKSEEESSENNDDNNENVTLAVEIDNKKRKLARNMKSNHKLLKQSKLHPATKSSIKEILLTESKIKCMWRYYNVSRLIKQGKEVLSQINKKFLILFKRPRDRCCTLLVRKIYWNVILTQTYLI